MPGGDILGMLIPMAIMIAIFYFLLIRPQSKQRKALEAKINSMRKGDKFVTTGGIYGTVIGVKDNIVVGKISDNVKVEINKGNIANVFGKDESYIESDDVDKKNNKKLKDKNENEEQQEENTETDEEKTNH